MELHVGQQWRSPKGALVEITNLVDGEVPMFKYPGTRDSFKLSNWPVGYVPVHPEIKVGDYWKTRDGIEHQIVGFEHARVHTESTDGAIRGSWRHGVFRKLFTINPGGVMAPAEIDATGFKAKVTPGGDIERERSAELAVDMLSELGYAFDGQSWVAPANAPLRNPPKCMQYDEATIDEKFRQLMGTEHTDLTEPAAALRTIGLAEGTITEVLDLLYRASGSRSSMTASALLTLQQRGFTWRGGGQWAPPIGMAPPFNAPDLLDRAAQHMKDRAATYDKPEGERSMAATVQAFNAQTGRDLTESEGWLLMVNLKIVRDRQRSTPHRDSVEDLVAYGALYGEARLNTVGPAEC